MCNGFHVKSFQMLIVITFLWGPGAYLGPNQATMMKHFVEKVNNV